MRRSDRGRRAARLTLALAAMSSAPGVAGAADGARDAEVERYEQAVLENVLGQRVGAGTVRDLALPEPLLRQVVDEEICGAYWRTRQIVYVDVPRSEPPANPTADGAGADWIAVRHHVLPAALRPFADRPNDRPSLRGFRMPVLELAEAGWPVEPPGASDPPALRDAADLVASGLARDGLMLTLARVIEQLGAESVAGSVAAPDRQALQLLARTGLPVDLLAFFSFGGAPAGDPAAVVAQVARRLAEGATVAALREELGAASFRFVPSAPGFRAAGDSGGGDLELLRVQLSRGSYWRGVGGGDAVDVTRQLFERLADVRLLITIDRAHLEPLLATVATWSPRAVGRVTVIAEPFGVSRWAQDNGKSGYLVVEGGALPATLVPRFASRRHDGVECIGGDSLVADGLAAAGHGVAQSPLLFQGGNMLCVADPSAAERLLLVGEAEVARNVALGLSSEQVIEALRLELGVDRCVVLPTVSYHLDFDVSPRVVDGEVVAFVNDPGAACRTILDAGIAPLTEGGVLGAEAAGAARAELAAGRDRRFLSIVAPAVHAYSRAGAFPLSLANRFATDRADSGVGNLQRFLAAMDILIAATLEPQEITGDPVSRSYLRTFRRAADRRRALHDELRRLGWRLVPVPSLSAGDRSLCALNGIHDRTRYVMPTYGGLYAGLDRAAAGVIERTLGPDVSVIGIRCGEAQRRIGGVRCSASAFARPTIDEEPEP